VEFNFRVKFFSRSYAVRKILLLLCLAFSSCARFYDPTPPIATMQMSMDGVKLIIQGEKRGDLAQLVNQSSYLLAEDRRLLIRFETFSYEVEQISVEGSNKVWVVVTPLATESLTDAQGSLRLCPIIRPWMMLATWDQGHPFGFQGTWETPGGDFDVGGCITPEIFETQSLRFDATTWFIQYPRGRSENFGFLLMSTVPVTIHGDQAGTFAPRFSLDSYTPKAQSQFQ